MYFSQPGNGVSIRRVSNAWNVFEFSMKFTMNFMPERKWIFVELSLNLRDAHDLLSANVFRSDSSS